jgi:thiamine-monophosphate kinase
LPGAPAGELWAGDDAALLRAGETAFVLTIDTLTEGVDFDLSYGSGADAGQKAMAQNVSDVAAMGATPGRAVVSLSLPSSTAIAVADDISAGLAAAASRWGVGLAGGDVGAASEISITIALTGQVGASGPVLRSGAAVGQALCVTGALGAAAAGLESLRASSSAPAAAHEARLRARQLRGHAQAEAGAALAGLATAMIDISDGLVVDLAHLLDASGVGCEVDSHSIPIDDDLLAFAAEPRRRSLDPLLLALTGGEDFELLFTLAEADVAPAGEILGHLGVRMSHIGTIAKDARRIGTNTLEDYRSMAWEHLRDR